jgi:hypothetical protein
MSTLTPVKYGVRAQCISGTYNSNDQEIWRKFFLRFADIHTPYHTPHKSFCMVEHIKGWNKGRAGQAAARGANL